MLILGYFAPSTPVKMHLFKISSYIFDICIIRHRIHRRLFGPEIV